MPIDKRAGESHDDFISRCMEVEVGSGMDQDQAYAICESKWNEFQKLSKVKIILVDEDFNEDVVKSYMDAGFKVHIRSKRKIRKKDKKLWNKIQRVNLDPALHLKFGEVKELNDKYDYDEINISGDPLLDKLMVMGKEVPGRVIASQPITSMEEALKFSSDVISSVDLKFITVKTYFRYGEKIGIPAAKTSSRPFCRNMMTQTNKLYTLEEIQKLPTSHLVEMGLPADVLAYKGGFYHNPETDVTTPDCRHTWFVEVRVER